jgi:hypothetical protein
VGALHPDAVQHGDRVGDRAVLAVAMRIGRDVRRRVAARGVRDAAVAGREVPHLRLPAAVVTGELVDEQQRLASAGDLGVQGDAVVSVDHGHDRPSG